MAPINKLKYFDWFLFVPVILLSCIGLVMVYSTGTGSAGESNLWLKQLLAWGIGLLGLFFLSTLDYRFFRDNSVIFYFLAIALLVGLLFFAPQIRGSRRWFDLGFINFQPSEFAKIAVLILLAKYFQVKKHLLQNFRYVLLSLAYVLVPALLVALQPDLGSATVLVALWLGMLVLSSMPRRFFLYLLVMFLVFAGAAWLYLLQDYQKDRLLTFFDPTSDPLGRGYNVIQSIVAVGSGGLLGQGLTRGLQSQLRFLPERQTDFIFASSMEELGLLGGGLILVLFVFLLYRIIKVMRESQDVFGMYFAGGSFFLIFVQSAVNIAMNVGLLPVTGITLPFLSYGGSSLVAVFWLMGILQSISRKSKSMKFG